MGNNQSAWWFGLGLWVLGSLVLADIVYGQSAVSFPTRRDFPVGGGPGSVTVGDFNGDGHLDLATANTAVFIPEHVSVLLGLGDGTFATAQHFSVGGSPRSVTVGDFNGDGRLDLATANFEANSVSVLLGLGDGTFATAQDFAVVGSPLSVTVGDFNSDGHLDLATAGVSILLGLGDGTFATAQHYEVGTNSLSVTVGDFNGDGHLDLATANDDDAFRQHVSVLLGRGDGITFATALNFNVEENPENVTVGDFNSDGHLDVAGAWVGFKVLILLGQGDGNFFSYDGVFLNDSGVGALFVTVGDFNGDGHLDLATANNFANTVSILLGLGDGTFATAQDFAVDSSPRHVTVGDFNGDGRLDLATANSPANTVSILINTTD